jgi:sugar/nucleoside kinase (ribokinase family)
MNAKQKSEFDVYVYGIMANSTVYTIRTPFPVPDGYAEISAYQSNIGGEGVCSAMVLSRLGVNCLLDGNWLGDSDAGRWLLETVHQRGVDVSRLTVPPGYSGPVEVVVSDDRSRTVFGQYVELLYSGRQWNIPCKEDVARARMACIDPFFQEESRLAVRFAVELGIPYVMIDCGSQDELATSPVALIISGEYRNREHSGTNFDELFEQYHQRVPGLVIFTSGGERVLYGRRGQPARSFAPYPIKPVDTAGAGDSFRAGVVYGLLQGWDDDQIIRYSSALAGLVCLSSPGVMNSPTHTEVLEFIQQNGAG